MSALLTEAGDRLLLEDGSALLLELVDVAVPDPSPTFLDLDRDGMVMLERCSFLDLDVRTRPLGERRTLITVDEPSLVGV